MSTTSFGLADAEPGAVVATGGFPGAAVVIFALDLGDRGLGEEIGPQVLVPSRDLAPQPLQGHAGVFHLLVAVVGEDVTQSGIGAQHHPLVVPVDRFDLLLQTDERAMDVASVLGKSFPRLVVVAHRFLRSVGCKSSCMIRLNVPRPDRRCSPNAVYEWGRPGSPAPASRGSRRGRDSRDTAGRDRRGRSCGSGASTSSCRRSRGPR